MIEQSSKLDPETRSFIMHTLGGLAAILKEETVKRFLPSPLGWLPRRRERYSECADAVKHEEKDGKEEK